MKIFKDARLMTYCAMLLSSLQWVAENSGTLPDVGAVMMFLGASKEAQGCKIGRVIDGDTVVMRCDGRDERARLMGFDAPELSKPQCARERVAAQASKDYLEAALRKARNVGMVHKGRDKYGRMLVRITLDGSDLAQKMIKAGHARAYDGGKRSGWCGKSRI